jgi:chromate transporter
VVTLIGWQVAGLAGALLATAAFTGPAFLVAYGASQLRERWHAVGWYKTIERGIAPITVGLIVASGWLLTDVAGRNWQSYLITAVTAACILFTRINPLIALFAAAVLGLTGII